LAAVVLHERELERDPRLVPMASELPGERREAQELFLRLAELAEVEQEEAQPHVAFDAKRAVLELLRDLESAPEILDRRFVLAVDPPAQVRELEGDSDLEAAVAELRGQRFRLGEPRPRIDCVPLLPVRV